MDTAGILCGGMTEVETPQRLTLTYQNPIWPGYFADPFVFRASDGFYYAYGTGPAADNGMRFPCLRSSNLVDWEARPHSLAPVDGCVNYWAPEVAEKDGRFYMFYSATTQKSDEHHRLRVATSATPDGPFIDSGKLLVPEVGFSIDGHPFLDPISGQWFLFFATDYTDDAPYGTGLAVSRLSDDLLSTVGEATCVVRASFPWQVYERDRDYKGRRWAEWNCIEGPFVLFRDTPVEKLTTNRIVIHIQPDEGITLHFGAKIPGPIVRMGAVDMDFNYLEHFGETVSTGYERLLYDCMIGDATLFQRADMVEASWSVVTPILDVWKAIPARDFPNYPSGTWGPVEADALLEKDGRLWKNPAG